MANLIPILLKLTYHQLTYRLLQTPALTIVNRVAPLPGRSMGAPPPGGGGASQRSPSFRAPQKRQRIASSWIVSAQKGHFMMGDHLCLAPPCYLNPVRRQFHASP